MPLWLEPFVDRGWVEGPLERKVGHRFPTRLADREVRPAGELLETAAAKFRNGFAFGPNADGYYLPADVLSLYTKREQAKVPLLAGWNADEGKAQVLLSPQKTTAASFKAMAERRFGRGAAEFLKLYPASTDDEALVSAEDLSGDDFIAFSTWKWIDLQAQSGAPVYQYRFEQVPKAKPGEKIGSLPAEEAGARHASEIEYVFQTLRLAHGDTPWAEDDFKVSDAMATYWTNFVKTGNPNRPARAGKPLPHWPPYQGETSGEASGNPSFDARLVMHLSGKKLGAAPDTTRPRYLFLEQYSASAPAN